MSNTSVELNLLRDSSIRSTVLTMVDEIVYFGGSPDPKNLVGTYKNFNDIASDIPYDAYKNNLTTALKIAHSFACTLIDIQELPIE